MPPSGCSEKFALYSHTNAKNEGIPEDALAIQVLVLLLFTRIGTAGFEPATKKRGPEPAFLSVSRDGGI